MYYAVKEPVSKAYILCDFIYMTAAKDKTRAAEDVTVVTRG